SAKRVASHVSEVTTADRTVRSGSSCWNGYATRYGERAQIKIVIRIALLISDRSYNIGTVERIAAFAVVIPEVVVGMEWLSTLQSENAVDAPAILQCLHAATAVRELITEVPGEAVRNVEAGRTIFQPRACAVVGLGLVWFEVFTVAGVIE